eukprot:UN30549
MINSAETVNGLIEWDKQMNNKIPIRCHVMLDTGMSRIGLDAVNSMEEHDSVNGQQVTFEGVESNSAAKVIKQLDDCKNLNFQAICTHMSTGDTKYTSLQYDRLEETAKEVRELGVKIPMIHSENTISLISDLVPDERVKKLMGDETKGYCRSGAGIYGQRESDKLKPVITLYTTVRHLHTVEAGTPVGYDRSWRAKEKSLIATLSCGFADGYNR